MFFRRFLGDKDISFALNDCADSEDGLDFDDDNLADPDFFPELDTFEEGAPKVEIDVDPIIETLNLIKVLPLMRKLQGTKSTAEPFQLRTQKQLLRRTLQKWMYAKRKRI